MQFHVDTVNFLGVIIQKDSLKADPSLVQAMAEGLVPSNRKQLQRFLRFANFYRRFIKNYITPQQTWTKFSWTQETDQAFEVLKS